jgi:hypothetical protein
LVRRYTRSELLKEFNNIHPTFDTASAAFLDEKYFEENFLASVLWRAKHLRADPLVKMVGNRSGVLIFVFQVHPTDCDA